MKSLISGTISDTPISAIFRSLYQIQKTGVLTIKRQDTVKQVLFQDGQIIFALSGDINDRIGIYCLKRSLITLKELEQAIMTQKSDRIGKTLLKMGAISKKVLVKAVQNHLTEIVYGLFSYSDGDYSFNEKKIPDENIKVGLSTGSIIFNGVKRMGQWTTIRKTIGDLHSVYCLSSNPIFRFQELKLNSEEMHILESINGKNTIEDICGLSSLSDYFTCKTLFGFISCGIIDRVHSIIKINHGIISEIERLYKDLDKNDDLALFGFTEKNITQKGLEEKYSSLIKMLHPDKLHKIIDKDTKIKGIKILKRVLRGYENLKERF